MRLPTRFILLTAVAASRFACASSVDVVPAHAYPPGLIAENERGVALMGRYKYEDAVELFSTLVAAHPDLPELRINLGIAVLNRQKEGDEGTALGHFRDALAMDPERIEAHYGVGLVLLRGGDAGAVEYLQRVVEADPFDGYAGYFYGSALELVGRRDEALDWYLGSIEIDPYLVSAYYRAAQVMMRSGRREEGRELLNEFQRLDKNPLRRKTEFVYMKMGAKAEAISLRAAALVEERPSGPAFAETIRFPVGSAATRRTGSPTGPDRPLGATAADRDRDGIVDLVLVPGWAPAGTDALNLLAVRDEDGTFSIDGGSPLARVPDLRTALWGDVDDDGVLDVYLCRAGPNLLLRGTETGGWEDVTAATETAAGSGDTVDGAILDADHDGDLDIFCVNADGPDELLNNDRDGTFRPLASERGIEGGTAPSRQVLAADLDGDRDTDLIVLRAVPPHAAFVNELGWHYSPAEGMDALLASPAVAMVSADFDVDGRIDLVTMEPGGALVRWRRGEDGVWSEGGRTGSAPRGAGGLRLLVLDVDGDGRFELLHTDGSSWLATSFGDDISTKSIAESGSLLDAIPVLLDPGAGPALLELPVEGPPRLRPAGPGRYPFLALSFTGRDDKKDSIRSNTSGIGTAFVARAAGRAVLGSTLRSGSGPGQGWQPVAIGLGGATALDHLAITWSDGVLQSEMNLGTGAHHAIPETQRQLSSCPVLFAWDGSRYAFVSDLLGVGGLGYLVAPGEYATPRPWENLLLPSGVVQPLRGRIALKLGEPMEEVCYLDRAGLAAHDVPPGWNVLIDERMSVLGPEPTGKALYFRSETLPARAVNDRGEDVTSTVTSRDLVAAPVGPIDVRFIGRLRRPHVLTLFFENPLEDGNTRPVLMADGWIEYPYSQTSFAAWQADAEFEAPTLEARNADGAWRIVAEQFGYPAGMPRRMAFPLEGLPPGCDAIRLTTNQEIYWDRIAIARTEACPEARRHVLPLATAELRRCGFPARTTGAQRLPSYDYAVRAPLDDTRHPRGHYTAFGDVIELVTERDDALAIFGPGEEIHLEYGAPDAPPAGWTRRLVFETDGWCKDMDLYTATGETLAPIPSAGIGGEAARALNSRYNVRYAAGS